MPSLVGVIPRRRARRCSPHDIGLTRRPTVEPGARRPTRSTWLTASRLLHAGTEDDIEVALRGVRPRIGDLGGRPAFGKRKLDFARRTGVDADASRLTRLAQPAEGGQDTLRFAVCLEGETNAVVDVSTLGSIVHGPPVLTDALEVIDQARRNLQGQANDSASRPAMIRRPSTASRPGRRHQSGAAVTGPGRVGVDVVDAIAVQRSRTQDRPVGYHLGARSRTAEERHGSPARRGTPGEGHRDLPALRVHRAKRGLSRRPAVLRCTGRSTTPRWHRSATAPPTRPYASSGATRSCARP